MWYSMFTVRAAFIIAIWVVFVAGYHGQINHAEAHDVQATRQDSPAHAASPITQPTSQTQQTSRYQKTNSYLKRALGPEYLASWCLVLAAGFGLFATFRTLHILKEQTEAAKASAKAAENSSALLISKERAKLSVSPYQEHSFFFDYVPPSGVAEVVIGVEQHGPTKAFNVHGEMSLVIQPSKDPPPMKNMSEMFELPDVINGDAPLIQASTIYVGTITQDLLDKIGDEETFVHWFGIITYSDVFGKGHSTRFRYIWEFKRVDLVTDEGRMPELITSRGWAKHGPPEDNDAT